MSVAAVYAKAVDTSGEVHRVSSSTRCAFDLLQHKGGDKVRQALQDERSAWHRLDVANLETKDAPLNLDPCAWQFEQCAAPKVRRVGH